LALFFYARAGKERVNLKGRKIDKPLIGKLESPYKRKEQRLYPEWWRGRPFEATATNISFIKKEPVGANSCPASKLLRGQMGTVLRHATIHCVHQALS